MAIIHYSNCPSCGSNRLENVFLVTDYTVSGEKFPVIECSNCSLRITQDIPSADAIAPYYKSEDYISHTHTTKGMISQLYQVIRKRTLASKRMLVQKVTGRGKGNLLDVGSGTGSFVNEMKLHGWEVTGIEPDDGARKIANDLYRVELKKANDFFNLPAANFHAITLWHVLEHVHDLHRYITQLKALMKPGGRLLIAVPNYTSKDAATYREYWAAYDVPRHLYHFSPKAMQMLIQEHGLKILDYKPMWYDSFYIGLLSSKYKYGSSKTVSAAFNGLVSNMNALSDVKKCSSIIYVIG